MWEKQTSFWISKETCSKRTFKDDFQSVLRTLESCLGFFVLFHAWRHKMWTFRNYIHEINSKFHVNRHYGREATETFMFCCFSYHLRKQLCSCIKQWSSWKNNLKGLKDKVCGFVTNNIDSHSIEWTVIICLQTLGCWDCAVRTGNHL